MQATKWTSSLLYFPLVVCAILVNHIDSIFFFLPISGSPPLLYHVFTFWRRTFRAHELPLAFFLNFPGPIFFLYYVYFRVAASSFHVRGELLYFFP